MADDTTTASATDDKATDDKATAATTAAVATDDVAAQANNPDAVKAALAAERATAKAARKEADELRQKVQEFEDKDKSEKQKLEDRASAAELEAKESAAKLLRFEVAAENDIPSRHAHRLQGSTKEELTADAKELAKELGANGKRPDFGGGARDKTAPSGSMDDLIRRSAGRIT